MKCEMIKCLFYYTIWLFDLFKNISIWFFDLKEERVWQIEMEMGNARAQHTVWVRSIWSSKVTWDCDFTMLVSIYSTKFRTFISYVFGTTFQPNTFQ